MNTATLTTAWTSVNHSSPLVADCWQLGPYMIVRVAGDSHYALLDPNGPGKMAEGGLEELKAEGAAKWAAQIAEGFKSAQIAPLEDGDVQVEDHGTISLVRLNTDAAREWVEGNVQDDARWFGNDLVVEPRFVPYLIEGMVDGGLTFGKIPLTLYTSSTSVPAFLGCPSLLYWHY